MPKRRRRRRPLNPTPFLWLAVLANIAAGLYYSPITSIRKLRIEGATEKDKPKLTQFAQTLKNHPTSALNPYEFETSIQKETKVDTADFQRSLFGSAGLKITYRKAVARVDKVENTYLDDTGNLFQTDDPPKNLPSLDLHESALKPALTIAGPSPTQKIARLIQEIPRNLLEKGLKIDVDSEGAVCLNIMQGARIDLGGADRLEEKLKKLVELLTEQPGLLQDIQELNLTEPSRPVTKPRKGANQ